MTIGKHEKIIRKPDGTRVKISVRVGGRYGEFKYITEIEYCPYKKRKWLDIVDKNDFEYRRLGMPERREFIKQARLKYVSAEKILEAQIELWEKLKPEVSD